MARHFALPLVMAGLCRDSARNAAASPLVALRHGLHLIENIDSRPKLRKAHSEKLELSTAEPPNDPKKRMGDEGELPATNTMSGAVPDMTDEDQ